MIRSSLRVLGLLWGAGALSPADAARVKASSELVGADGTRHGAALAFDGDLTTAWAEGEVGTGAGAWIELQLDRPTEVRSLSVWPGDLRKGERSLKENGRPHTIQVILDDGQGEVVETSWRVRDGAEHGIQRVDIPVEGVARRIRLVMEQAYAGYIHNDLYLSEIAINFTEAPVPGLDAVEKWAETAAGQKASEAHFEHVVDLFDRVTTSDFGDSEALAMLGSYAANGAPWWHDRVARSVPLGFRIQATPPDEPAVEALLKIKDPNAIPSLTMAALRTHGKQERKLLAAASYFSAFAELKGGGRRSVEPWGTSGWEPGALRGLDEPLAIGLGAFGDVYVADVANHRVSVFGQDGRLRTTWGTGKPTVTRAWIGGERSHYASGRDPAEGDRGFVAPLDLHVEASPKGDVVTVYDAAGWVRQFDEDGDLLARWRVFTEMAPAPGYGGAAHVMQVRKQVVVIQGTDAVVYGLDGEEVGRWQVGEGAPITATALKNGRLVLGFRSGAATYDLKGRRISTFLGDGDLPLGYEAWALATDEKGKVWAVTDHGWALQMAPSGKILRQVQVAERGLEVPRLAVREDLLFVSSEDRVRRFDVPAIEQAQREADAP